MKLLSIGFGLRISRAQCLNTEEGRLEPMQQIHVEVYPMGSGHQAGLRIRFSFKTILGMNSG